MAQTLKREFPFGFHGHIVLPCDPGVTGMPFVLERPIHLLAVEAKAVNMLLKLDIFRFLLTASSAVGSREFCGGVFVCHHLMVSNSEP